MKKRKMLRNASLVALSAVMLSGVALAATACGGGSGDPTTITVNIFCSRADEHTNRTICETWAKQYSAAHPEVGTISIDFNPSYDKDTYFANLNRAWSSDKSSIADIIYLSPKYVQSYANAGYVLDLADYLVADGAGETMSGIWNNAISYYGYKNTSDYILGSEVEYREANGANPAGFYTKGGSSTIGIYGLPKDYSNFSMGYNKLYFSDALRYAYQTTLGSTQRTISSASKVAGATDSASGKQYVSTYTGSGSGSYVATFAANGQYQVWNPESNTWETKEAKKGQEAPLICIGVPVTYKPFNFYRYNDFDSAYDAGDPIATTVKEFSLLGNGYTVTIPGFPGDTFDIAANTPNTQDPDAYYDSGMGHIVYTYAEYGALVWAVTYYLNTFDWQNADGDNNATTGNGGLTTGSTRQVIYGSEQYEGVQGNALYLLPWLASNDADLIDSTSTKCFNDDTSINTSDPSYNTNNASKNAGTKTEPITKLNLDGTTREAAVQYGFNSANFIETYAAFQEFGSTWNGNSGNAGDESSTKDSVSGWDYFCSGAAVFYGAGTWDAATRNDTKTSVFEFGQMPSPVAEKYALYSAVNNADYSQGGTTYSNANNTKGTESYGDNDSAQRSKVSDGCKVYSLLNTAEAASGDANTYDELIRNQILRQDKWAARMDSVGYAANGRFASLSEDDPEYWKAAGCASLIQALTIGETEQITLTYAGAQLPNYKEQCLDFLYYQDDEYNAKLAAEGRTNCFADMITPDGSATVKGEAGAQLYKNYYNLACAMAEASTNSSTNGVTVEQWIGAQTASTYGLTEIKYDPQYANTKLSEFTGEKETNIGFAMKVLRMVAFTYADRDLNIRMQYGINSVRDSSMYTASTTWLGYINGSTSDKMLAYVNQKTLTQSLSSTVARTESQKGTATVWTPAIYCMNFAVTAQQSLTSGK